MGIKFSQRLVLAVGVALAIAAPAASKAYAQDMRPGEERREHRMEERRAEEAREREHRERH